MVQNSGVLGYKTITLSGFCGTKLSLFSIFGIGIYSKMIPFLWYKTQKAHNHAVLFCGTKLVGFVVQNYFITEQGMVSRLFGFSGGERGY